MNRVKRHIWKTKRVIEETPSTLTIVFDTGREQFEYMPGQFINLTLLIKGELVTRSYSLSSAIWTKEDPSITIKRVDKGLMSNYILDQAREIREWFIEGPFGSFTPAPSVKHLVLLAGGSGITPLYSIARYAIEHFHDVGISLIYSNRTADDIIFREQIEDLHSALPARVKAIHFISAPGAEENALHVPVVEGRVNKLAIKKTVRNILKDAGSGIQYFICGPSALMKLHREALLELGIPEEHIYIEHFLPEPETESFTFPDQLHEVLIHVQEQSNLLEVQPGESILDAAIRERIGVPNSCKNGTCGKCVAKLSSGEVVMRKNSVLRKEELEEGLVILCQSYPVDDNVTVEID